MAIGDGYGLPTFMPNIQNAVSITQGLNAGIAMVTNPTSTINGAVKGAISAINLPSVDAGLGWTQALFDRTTNTFMATFNSLTDFQTHTDGHVSNIGPRMGTFNSDKNLQQTLSPVSDVCASITNFFGSLMGAGNELLNRIMAPVQAVLGLITQGIAALVAQIEAILNTVDQLITEVINMIAAEIAALANAVSQAIKYALSSLLGGLGNNSCLNLLVGAVGTASLFGIIGPRP